MTQKKLTKKYRNTVMSSDQRESRHLYTYLYRRFLHSLRSVEMTILDFLVGFTVFIGNVSTESCALMDEALF